ncbi:MAG: hypothetical protein NDP13_01975 [Crenarchaeota archaeon]|nr:hypothetical protein [Thermoproteota archaeon]
MKRKIGTALVALFLIFNIAGAVDLYSKPPMWHGNASTVEGDGIVVQFLENKPWYMIWIPGKNNTAVYIVKFNRLIEFLDLDNDNKFNMSIDYMLSHALLYSAMWDVSAKTINISGIIEIRVTLSAIILVQAIGGAGGGAVVGSFNATFVNHIYSANVEVDAIPIAGGKELKIDVIISGWPWINNESKLALEIVFAGMFRGRQGIPECVHERYQAKNKHMSRVRLAGGDAGYYAEFRYQEEAKIQQAAHTEPNMANVSSTNCFSKDSAVTWLVYPHFDGTLIHDPSIYVGSEGILEMLLKTPVIGIIVVAAILIIAAILIKRRK